MSTPAESSGVRGTRYALLTVFFVGLRRRNPGAVVNAVAAAAGTYLPDFIARAYGVELEPWQRAYVNTAMLTHAVGCSVPTTRSGGGTTSRTPTPRRFWAG